MYIRSKPFSNLTSKVRVQIIESVRLGNKVSQKIVRHVGVAHDANEEARMREYAQELILKIKEERDKLVGQTSLLLGNQIKLGRPAKKDLSQIIPTDKVALTDIREVKRLVDGVHDIGNCVYNQLGFDKLLSKKRDKDILLDITLSRMINPDSKRGLQRLLTDQFDKEHDLDAIYRMMDKLHPQISRIKELCFTGSKNLIPNREISLAFFDVTTLYFESTECDALRAFGYSKDHRFNTTQVVLALATNEDGLPIGYELFSGNTAEVKTLLSAIDSWKEYLNIKELCFVADRAMFSRSNLETLEKSGYKYIVAAKLRSLNKDMQDQILSEENYIPTILGNRFAWIGEFEYEGKRLITSYKTSRAINDAKSRQTIISKIQKTLGNKSSSKKLVTNQGIKKYTSMQETIVELDEQKISEDALWDGLHGVITNDQSLSPNEAIARYARLWVIEESFRINKHNLEMRPIYHYTKERIESHIALCYMSFTILRHIEYKVALTQKISPKEIMALLLNTQSSIYEHKVTKDLYRVPGVTTNNARKIYRSFNVHRSCDAEIYHK
ncbi:MAG: IS1634 family transposase [Rickettsiaceae bacterium]|nr:IS1634 family transposase [Rickettsiaceae bacterium]